MMNKIKSLLICVSCLIFISGCSIKYNLNVKDFEENFDVNNILINSDNEFVSPTDIVFQGRPYNIEFLSSTELISQQRWQNLDAYLENSILINDYIDKDAIEINGKIVSFKFSLKSGTDLFINSIGKVDNIEFSLEIPYFVINHNANKVSKNKYTWIINDIENQVIEIKFDMSKPADFIKKIILYSIIGIVVIVLICVIIYFVNKNKKANEI